MKNDWKEQQPFAYWLAGVEGLGNKSRHKLTEYAGSPKAVYEMKENEWRELLPEKKVHLLAQSRREVQPKEQYEEFAKGDICFIPFCHPRFPQRLKEIGDAPYGLFVKGGLPKEQMPSAAVIGARQCSEYGRYIASQCAGELARRGVNVISGMARGIDGIAHHAALASGGSTYAVLGCGADVCYPPEHRDLYEKLGMKGGIISEYMPKTQPRAGLFPARNRLISGLADVVLIVEARQRSGTLITADMALEQGKEVYAVPGRLTDPLSEGCNRLIAQGAGVLTSIEEMLVETGLIKDTGGQEREEVSETEKSGVMSFLDYYPKSAEQLQRESGMEYRQLILELTGLCMEDKAKQVSTGHYIRKNK